MLSCKSWGLILAIWLAWDPSPSTNVVGYKLFYGDTSGLYSASALALGGSNSLHLDLPLDHRRYFAIAALGPGLLSSVLSPEISYPNPVIVTVYLRSALTLSPTNWTVVAQASFTNQIDSNSRFYSSFITITNR